MPGHPYIPDDERVIGSIKPSVLSIALRPLVMIAVVGLLALTAQLISARFGPAAWGRLSLWSAGGLVAARLAWETLVWASRRYVLTDRRVIEVRGVLQRHATEIALDRVQHVLVFKTIRERVFGLGTIGFASAGTGAPDIAWVMIARPHRALRTVRQAIGTAPDAEHEPGEDRDEGIAVRLAPERAGERPESRPARARARPVVIGLAGGIGAGKSRVARELERLGCLVIDSDAQARDALRREEVKRELVSWWGEGILDDQGHVDRSRVAKIVFQDPSERERLEELIHPLVKRSRAELIEAAGDRPAIVIDAPLLFEAGVDAECDEVWFVDAPREARVERVRETRGWDENELARRESAQMPLDEKRRRSTRVIANAGPEAGLRRAVEQALDDLSVPRATPGE